MVSFIGGGNGENHRPVASHWQNFITDVVSSTPRHKWGCELTTLVVIGTDCTGIQLLYDHGHHGPVFFNGKFEGTKGVATRNPNQTKNNTYGQHKDNKTILSTTKHIIYQIREVTWLWKVQLMLNKIDIYIYILYRILTLMKPSAWLVEIPMLSLAYIVEMYILLLYMFTNGLFIFLSCFNEILNWATAGFKWYIGHKWRYIGIYTICHYRKPKQNNLK